MSWTVVESSTAVSVVPHAICVRVHVHSGGRFRWCVRNVNIGFHADPTWRWKTNTCGVRIANILDDNMSPLHGTDQ